MVLNGNFNVIKNKDRFRIYYLEKTTMILCSRKSFDAEIDAKSYIDNHKAELEEYVSNILEEQKRKEDAKIEQEASKTAKKEQKEEEKNKKQAEKQEQKEKKKAEKEQKKQDKKEEKAKKKQAKKEEKEKNKETRKKVRNAVIATVLATTIGLVGGHFAWVGISNLIENNKDKDSSKDEPTEPTINTGPTTPIKNDIDNIVEKDEELTQENFENLVVNFAQPYINNNVNVTTEELTKFVSIVNIDKLAEENPELAAQLFGTQTKEEYLQDAAKIIGMTYTYNRNVFEKEGSTENFIRISESVSGPQKERLQIIESYVDQIALVKDNPEEVNKLVSELIVRLGDPQSELSYLDNGVGFGMQVNIELIRSYLAKDVLTKENFDMLSTMTSSEEYVSNIFTIYDKCTKSSGYSRTRG